jgi:hypothetical protein
MAMTQKIWSVAQGKTLLLLLLLGGLAAWANAQNPGPKPQAEAAAGPQRMEYLHQDVQADAIVQSLNDLDGQGWGIFQIVPAWQFKNDGAEAALVPKTYQVFGRRPLRK